jgi:hypothetical protein
VSARLTAYRIEVARTGFDILADGGVASFLGELAGAYVVDACAAPIKLRLTEGQAPFTGRLAVTAAGTYEEIPFAGDFDGNIDVDRSRATVRVAAAAVAVESVLRATFSILALRASTLWLHSVGLVRGGGAFVLAGKSGAGKSTLHGLAVRDFAALGQDTVAVRMDGDLPVAHSTPFQSVGTMRPPVGAAPLQRLFLLAHGPVHARRRLDKIEALTRLWPCVLSAERSLHAQTCALDLLDRLLSSVQAYELRFAPNAGALSLICEP